MRMGFYDQLKDIRKSKGYTIREVAERSGVSAAYISQLENGNRRVPSPHILWKLSEGLDIPYTELMRLAGYWEENAAQDESGADAVELRQWLRRNRLKWDGIELTEEDKEWIERMIAVLFWKERKS